MNSTITHKGRLAACIAAALLTVGCASKTAQPLYGWDGYQPQVYEHLKSGGNADAEQQVAKLEVDRGGVTGDEVLLAGGEVGQQVPVDLHLELAALLHDVVSLGRARHERSHPSDRDARQHATRRADRDFGVVL